MVNLQNQIKIYIIKQPTLILKYNHQNIKTKHNLSMKSQSIHIEHIFRHFLDQFYNQFQKNSKQSLSNYT